MSPIPTEILQRLADVSVRAILLLAIAWPAARLVRTPAARHGIWSALLAGMLAMPMLTTVLPPMRSTLVTRFTSPLPGFDGNIPVVTVRRAASNRTSVPVTPQPQRPRWPAFLAYSYLAILLALLTRFYVAYRFSLALVRRSAPIEDDRPLQLLEQLAAAQSRPLPALRASHSLVVPVTIGWRNPVVLVPADWQSWDDWKLQAVLAHELAHVCRGDWLVTVAASLNRCLFWFHPLAWWLERHLSTLSEQACDEAALHTVSDATRYARAVLEFATALEDGRRVAYGVAMARTAKVSRRIDRILELRKPGPGIMRKGTWIAVLACALPLVYGAAALQVTHGAGEPAVHAGWAQMLTEGSNLSAAEVQDLQAQLASGTEDVTVRGKLISYYHSHNMPDPFREQVYGLVEQHPESEISLYASNLRLGSATDSGHVKALWLDAVAGHPRNARVLANAARYIGAADDQFAEEDLLKRARQIEPVNPEWLKLQADLLARAIYHSFFNQAPVFPHVQSNFVDAAKTELETSTDDMLVGTVGEFLLGGPPGGHPAEPAQEFAEHLLHRAQSLRPDNPEWVAALERLHAPRENMAVQPAADSSQQHQRIRVGPEVQQSNLIEQTVPDYPPLAKQARIQGVVRFSVIIGKDGHVGNMTLVSGHPLLVQAAQQAVKQWLYRPTLLNGDPVEVATLVDVQFTLAN